MVGSALFTVYNHWINTDTVCHKKIKENNMNKQELKKLCRVLTASLIFVMIVIPFIIHYFSQGVNSEITADGLLGYLGNCITAFPTIVIAAIAIWQSFKANKIAEEANNEAIKSDEISKKLLELEEHRQRLELRPSFAVINWCAPIKAFSDIVKCPEMLSIQVGEYSENEEAWGIELELLNTSSGFESVCYREALNDKGEQIWLYSMAAMRTRKIELPPLKSSKIYFYAGKDFWHKAENDNKIIVNFDLNNRLDDAYREKFEMIIMSMSDDVIHKNGEVHLYLEIQNYNIGEYVGKSNEYPDGIIWEK